jgi:DNA invertase Pin-like site-specific DNA recombinase
LKQQQPSAAIYCRLSRDDGFDSESNSIGNQREMLQRYCAEKGFPVYKVYVDDGISGTTFERPSFKEMIADIENRNVNIVVVKDLSRLGRNNAIVAHYTEMYFPQNDIRFIAINDGIDTFQGDNEIIGFKSILNEFYARDISKKVRSSKRISAMKGEFIGGRAAYGYDKDPSDKHKLIIDEVAAANVKRLYALAASGKTPTQICTIINKEQVLIPSAYRYAKSGHYGNAFNPDFPYRWTEWSVRNILKNRVYLGEMVSSKQRVKSFKHKKLLDVPEDEWIIVKGTHEPLIDYDTFEKVQAMLKIKNPVKRCLIDNIFVGKLVCSDCGRRLGFSSRVKENALGRYICNGHRNHTGCSPHSIPYNSLYSFVLEDISRRINEANLFDGEMENYITTLLNASDNTPHIGLEQELNRYENRLSELGNITKKLFEQNPFGIISDDMYRELLSGYQNEMAMLKTRISEIKNNLNQAVEKSSNAERFFAIMSKYSEIAKLDRELVCDLIDKIVVYEASGGRKDRRQRVDIHYRYLGEDVKSSVMAG